MDLRLGAMGAAASVAAAVGVAAAVVVGCASAPQPEPGPEAPEPEPEPEPTRAPAGEMGGLLLRAQSLVERLRPVAAAFQAATQRSKAESQRQLESGAEGGIASYVRQHAAMARNRDSSVRLLKRLRALMDAMLGGEMPSDDDSWSDSDDDGDGAEPASALPRRLRAIEQETALLEKRALRLPGAAHGDGASSAPSAESREALLQAETAALQAAAAQPPAASSAESMRALITVVEQLRAVEGSFEFQAAMMRAHQRLDSTTEYSRDNFAYGSTPWQSWLRVHTDPGCEALAAAVKRCAADDSAAPEYTVFGSSLGWLCFYAALTFSVRAVGYEIVEPLVEHAERIRAQHCGRSFPPIQFHCADMLSAPLDRCGVLLLTSRCWDKPLAQALHAKLIRELPRESVVLDYCADLAEAGGGVDGFKVVGSAVVPVSWDDKQRMVVMQRDC